MMLYYKAVNLLNIDTVTQLYLDHSMLLNKGQERIVSVT